MRIAILLPNWIGDVVMATPALRAIHNRFGADSEIALAMRPRLAEVLAGTRWADQHFYYDRKSDDPELRSLSLLRKLRAWKPDTMVLMTNSLWAGAVSWLSGAKTRVGYVRNGRGPLLSRRLLPRREGRQLLPVSAIDYYLQLAYALECPPEPYRMELATLPLDEKIADQVWRRLRLDHASAVVVLNTGSAVGSAKHWPSEYYVEFARRIVAESDNAVLIICGPAERSGAEEIVQSANHPRIQSMADQDLSIGVAKACVRRSQLMVTTDSGPRHFAPAFGVPVITMFGPIDARWSDSHFSQATNLSHPVDCGPCGKAICPFDHHRCMRDLTVDTVYAAVQQKLAALPRTQRRVG